MDKTIEIKRRAQRCILNGDLNGALREYEKLVNAEEADPYHWVLLADLLYKKGDHGLAGDRYLTAVDGYEKAALYKNAIAVCKKMSRLSLAPQKVLRRLAKLHKLEGLGTEASLYYMQHAETCVRNESYDEAIESLRLGYEACSENVKALERLAEVHLLADRPDQSVATLTEAIGRYNELGQFADAVRCQDRVESLKPGATKSDSAASTSSPPSSNVTSSDPPPAVSLVPQGLDPNDRSRQLDGDESRAQDSDPERLRAIPRAADLESHNWPVQPGLKFDAPADEGRDQPAFTIVEEEVSASQSDLEPLEPETEPAPDRESRPVLTEETAHSSGLDTLSISQIGRLLSEAEEHFARGEAAAASRTLVTAATAYEQLGHLDSAATIYRGLNEARQDSVQVLTLWLKNCEAREDYEEASRVALVMGNRAMTDGNQEGAREWFERARAFDPSNTVASARVAELNTESVSRVAIQEAPEGGQGDASSASTVSTPEMENPGEPNQTSAPDAGLGLETEDEPLMDDAAMPDLGWLISEFRRGVAEQLANDSRAHYDLGVSYREMGLIDEAIAAFRLALTDPEVLPIATEMMGRCLLDQGRVEDAVAEYRTVLNEGALDAEAESSLRYQLGLALESAGRQSEALEEFERIPRGAATYGEVARRIKDLRGALRKA